MTTKNPGQQEGEVAKKIETGTAKIPSDVFLWAAGGAMAISLGLRIAGRKNASLFVGQWAPAILLMGVYNKIVKVAGHDASDNGSKQSDEAIRS